MNLKNLRLAFPSSEKVKRLKQRYLISLIVSISLVGYTVLLFSLQHQTANVAELQRQLRDKDQAIASKDKDLAILNERLAKIEEQAALIDLKLQQLGR